MNSKGLNSDFIRDLSEQLRRADRSNFDRSAYPVEKSRSDIDPRLRACSLFNTFTCDELDELFAALSVYERHYKKGETMLSEGEVNYYIRLLISGNAVASKNAVTGNNGVYALVRAGNVFGDVIAASGGTPSEVSVIADSDCICMFIDYRDLTDPSLPAPGLRMRLITNIMQEISHKYFVLRDRLDCIEQPTLRRKLLCYLRLEAGNSQTVYTPLNRDQLAAYLCCDRSALCREMSAMKQEGIIDYYRGTFKLL